ncbi:VHA-F [Scenedesmus sp. PABB004]|nr:VHA-F [Scenedesmus sp. PABB004]
MAQQQEGALVAVIADEDTITGFLLAGVGDVDLRKRSNFLVVDGKTTVRAVEAAFRDFTSRDDVAIVLISQPIANMIRHVVAAHNKPVPALLEIPSKDAPYDPNQDSLLTRPTPRAGVGRALRASGPPLLPFLPRRRPRPPAAMDPRAGGGYPRPAYGAPEQQHAALDAAEEGLPRGDPFSAPPPAPPPPAGAQLFANPFAPSDDAGGAAAPGAAAGYPAPSEHALPDPFAPLPPWQQHAQHAQHGRSVSYPGVALGDAGDDAFGGGHGLGAGGAGAPDTAPQRDAAPRHEHRASWSAGAGGGQYPAIAPPLAALILLAFLAATGFYLYVRATFTLAMGGHTWYGVLVFVTELLGLTSVLPYGLLLPVATLPAGTRGLPVDDGRVVLPPGKRFRVHILVPCYKESLAVITNTVTAALAAEVPPGVSRTLWLCDDGKDAAKAAFIATLGDDARYVSGRVRAPGEINGKSANLNNALRNVIFPAYAGRPPSDIPGTELVVVFDADMAARRNFLLKVLEALWDDRVSLVLTPQAFSNIAPGGDIFNNINQQFWEYVLPGCDAWGYIACTGTNFCIRARALATVGWFPEYTITEDYALSMELKAAGLKGRYLAEYLAVGEAPDEVRNVCRQRSRWTKGHMQIFFSRRSPLLNGRLPLVHKMLYTNGTWAYFTTILTTLVFLFVPFNSLVFGLHPVAFGREFALAASLYLPLNFALMNYARTPRHVRGQWMAQVSNHILTFTYMKAVANTLLSLAGVKATAGFKATDKSGGDAAGPLGAIKSLMNRAGSGGAPGAAAPGGAAAGPAPPLAAAAAAAAAPRGPPPRPPPMASKLVVGGDGRPYALPPRPLTPAEVIQAQLRARGARAARRAAAAAAGPGLSVSAAALAAGVFSVVRSGALAVRVSSWSDFTQVFTSGRLDVYLLVPMLWALYNAIPPVLFFVYFFHKGRLLRALASFLRVFGTLLALLAIGSLWLGMAVPYRGAVGDAPIKAISSSLGSAISKARANMPALPPGAP